MSGTISSINYCPVKSVSFQSIETCEIKKNIGIVGDRVFAFVKDLDPDNTKLFEKSPEDRKGKWNKLLTLKNSPVLNKYNFLFKENQLILTSKGKEILTIDVNELSERQLLSNKIIELENFLKEAQRKAGYQPVITPHIGSKDLYVTSGHYAKYGEDSFQPIKTPSDGEEFLLKPMNCPHHCEIFKARPRTYKDLPVRFAEFGTVYRYEQSGELHGLTRVRGFTQDDAHIFCTNEQVKEEVSNVIDLVLYIFKTLDFKDFIVQVSLRDKDKPEKYIGSDENWEKAETAIREVAESKNLETIVEYGEAAFYGPKLDFMVRDAIGRTWQLGTVQIDYNLPERFELEYTGADNAKHRPVMIHRAPFGSMERFVAILIEHCAGKFPLWLTPEQARVLALSDKYNDYAEEVSNVLENHDIRALVDSRSEKVGRKIRDAELEKIPYMLIVGENEKSEGTVSVRKQGEGDVGTMTIEAFAERIRSEVAEMIAV